MFVNYCWMLCFVCGLLITGVCGVCFNSVVSFSLIWLVYAACSAVDLLSCLLFGLCYEM